MKREPEVFFMKTISLEEFKEMFEDDTDLPLPNGTQVNPMEPWVLPSNEQEK